VADRLVITVVPVLATANTAVAAVDRLKERGAKDIRLVCLISAPEGIERMRGIHPDVRIWTAAIDEGLDEQAFIMPGLGDAGDRAFGTK
jgi:uracil phosphoribosyltransferase